MIEGLLLFWLSVIDIRKKEIPAFTMIGWVIIWGQVLISEGKIEIYGCLIGCFMVLFSVFSHQAIGLADTIVFLLLGMRYGSAYILLLMTYSLICLLIFEGGFIVLKRRKHESLSFLPFITLAMILM